MKSLMRPLRILLVVCVCAFLFFTQAIPAYAGSNPAKGEETLNAVQKESEKILKQERPAPAGLEANIRSEEGLNEVQGAANAEKMYNPANSGDTETVEKDLGKALNKVAD
ncbi:MAG: low temperature-induced protein [Oscillatoria sp. PMC 1051.18]|nr:low temperature-induced protein [Oscillatoria sp. PMC 1050.18]MEC5031222.1 low temperature-induced protein [Oscillatoria sp. PMC 1051.18]